ncbi:hypothetical protein JCGZ_09848 [Jatropha curcas]|uniref:Uncharacterized protein n=1 Tax=Jatropha curcas TaxID=180498 RepID=A0A067J903_JATCU|nr:hypothetical protein JCGZ_09848 [Jatropha curcas]
MLETHLVSLYGMSPPGCNHVSIPDYNEVSQLYEAAHLKLALASVISGRIPVVEEVLAMPQLDVDPASLILPIFGFLAYEMLSYDFGANVVPLRLLVDCALVMDRTSPYLPSLACFCILSQYLLLSGTDSYDSLRLVP